jgi:hypothetical protein
MLYVPELPHFGYIALQCCVYGLSNNNLYLLYLVCHIFVLVTLHGGANEAGVFLAQSDYCRMNEDLALSIFDFDSDKEM